MTIAEKLTALRDKYEAAVQKLQKEANVCGRCRGWGKVGVSELGTNREAVLRMRAMEPPCGLCSGTGRVRICECCGTVR